MIRARLAFDMGHLHVAGSGCGEGINFSPARLTCVARGLGSYAVN